MTLKKTCPMCGKVIDYNQKYCEECEKKYEQEKTEKNRYYDKYYRDKEGIEFYNSKEWNRVKKMVKTRDHGLCRLCLMNDKINFVDVVHHIVERKENKELALDPDNCICLCNSCHNYVHAKYKKSKREMQEILRKAMG
ncbi:HNH endonuclease [Clostridium tepidiprofundi DSM 19306]|uniref:Putative HNH nuclease YajD n=1 Tax=Clostridium tepidiprofundi DSM 19306 TaxID=1121338 RepID=A0A151B7R0_9CLOT|nr:HNH endonuclease [Clostridium tepidiprofundi]KYH35843.1 HNH endonuclease [Clostridium tepidiprofundi DSM 19306]